MKLEKYIGSGLSSNIFQLQDEETKKQFALKQVKIEKIRNIEIIKEIKGKNISYMPKLIDYAVKADYIYLLEEWIHGETLYSLSRKRINFANMIRWKNQIYCGVEHLHNQAGCIVHGDITPSNIMISKNKDAYLIDLQSSDFAGNMSNVWFASKAYTTFFSYKTGILTKETDYYAIERSFSLT